MRVPFNDLTRQHETLRPEIEENVLRQFRAGRFIGGEPNKNFEATFAELHGVNHCVGVANGTDGLLLSLLALDVKPGDRIITSAISFFATAEAIIHAGAVPVFVDIDPKTYCLDLDGVRKILRSDGSRIVGILPVHLYGRAVDMPALAKIAEESKVWVLEDAAQAHLATSGGKCVGSWGQLAVFSFYPGKNLGAYGDAGAVVTNSPELALRVRKLANHGRTSKYEHDITGFNSRLDTVQACVLNTKMKRLPEWTAKRIAIAQKYSDALSALAPGLVTPHTPTDGGHVYHLYVVRTPRRQELQKYLEAKGVETLIHYPVSIPFLAAFRDKNYQRGDFPNSYLLQEQALSLPIFPEMTDDEQNYVIRALQEFFARPK